MTWLVLAVWVLMIPVTFVGFARYLHRDSPEDRLNPAAAAGWAFFWPIFVPLAFGFWVIPRLYRAALGPSQNSRE